FAAGWFRAVLLLTALAIALVVALPYLLNWFEPAPAPKKAETRPTETASAPVASAPVAPTPAAPAPVPTAAAPVVEKATTEKRAGEKPRQTLVPVPGMPRAASAAPVKASSALPQPTKLVDTPRAERLAAPPAKPDVKPAAGQHWVQVGIFKDPKNAEAL